MSTVCRFTSIKEVVKYRVYSALDAKHDRLVIVKFVEHYRPNAHHLWANAGLAVELLELSALSNGFSMLVMPLLEQAAGWMSCRELQLPRAQLLSVKALVLRKLTEAHSIIDALGRQDNPITQAILFVVLVSMLM
jgi:hypothetical protein